MPLRKLLRLIVYYGSRPELVMRLGRGHMRAKRDIEEGDALVEVLSPSRLRNASNTIQFPGRNSPHGKVTPWLGALQPTYDRM